MEDSTYTGVSLFINAADLGRPMLLSPHTCSVSPARNLVHQVELVWNHSFRLWLVEADAYSNLPRESSNYSTRAVSSRLCWDSREQWPPERYHILTSCRAFLKQWSPDVMGAHLQSQNLGDGGGRILSLELACTTKKDPVTKTK